MKLRDALARRTRRVPAGDIQVPVSQVPASVLDGVRAALLGGETHYTSRPGIAELRERIAAAMAMESSHDYGLDDVVVTSGSAEAVFVILLGLAVSHGRVRVPANGEPEHDALFRLMGLEVDRVEDSLLIAFDGSPFAILDIGAKRDGFPGDFDAKRTLIVGNLDALEGLGSFRVGFVCGPAAAVKEIRRWKQALSICTAAPSQRAAYLSLSR